MFALLDRARLLRLVVTMAVLTALYVTVPVVAPRLLPSARADQPVSGAFALGGGLGGQVDPRTGQFSVSVPLTTVASRGTSNVTFNLSWDQSRAGAGVDRYGFGSGWSLGTTFVDPSGEGVVYPADGGAYGIDDDGTFDSNLQNYPLRDLTFARATGTIAAQPPAFPDDVDYSFTVTFDDGRVDYFDGDGNLAVRTDRFGNRTQLTYTQIGDTQWQPTSIIDAYGQTTTFSYDADSMTVSAPARSDGVVARTTVTFDANNDIQTITDPTGGVASFAYSTVSGSSDTTEYLDQVTGPSGATSVVGYTERDYSSTFSLVVAQTLDVRDGAGQALTPTRTFDIDPPENDADHNFAGYNSYVVPGTDALYASADPDYRYTTSITNGLSTTLSTYDSAHRLVVREIRATDDAADDPVRVQRQTMTYPDLAFPQNQPGNYARPLTTTIEFSARSGPNGFTAAAYPPRTTTTSNTYDDHGRITSKVGPDGTTTQTTYDDAPGHFGLITSVVATGRDGTRRAITNTLSADGSVIKTTSRAEAKSGGALTARNAVDYAYDAAGQLTTRTVRWADGAAPPDDGGGPPASTTSYEIAVDPVKVRKTITATVGAGTPAAQVTTTVVDLVTGLPIEVTDALGRTTTRAYDAGGRVTELTPPNQLATTTTYAAADVDDPTGKPATKTVADADGHRTVTSYDALGRTTKITDNVKGGLFTGRLTDRTLSTTTYDTDGATVTSVDQLGRTTKTVSDSLGRPVREIGPTGVIKDTVHDDAANTTTTTVTPDNGTRPYQVIRVNYDAVDRKLSTRTSYPVSGGERPLFLVDPISQTSYDGIGRPSAVTADNLTMVPNYAGPGGLPTATTITPAASNTAPGDPITMTPTTMLDAGPTLRTLQQGAETPRVGTKVRYDAAGNLTSSTDPNGKTTAYTYTADGRLQTRTSPSGAVTRNTYSPGTGQLVSASLTSPQNATTTTTYTYVQAGSPGAGMVATVTDPSGTITYGYDADRNRTSITYPDGAKVTNVYLDNGQQQSTTDITGAVTTYVYNADSSVKSATQVRGGATLASVAYLYDGLGRVTSTTRGNGLVTQATYTSDSLVQTLVTTDKTGKQVEAHAYTYDRNHNLTRRTDTTAKPSRCAAPCAAGAASYGTWTTTYRYDAYQRLISSAVYPGDQATGPATTTVGYALDVSGNVGQTVRTTRTAGTRPVVTTLTTNDSFDDAGQLVQRKAGTATTTQTFVDGRVQNSLSGTTTTYRSDGLPATVTTKTGAKTTFSYWADGSRRRASTVDPSAGTSSIEYHYSPDGVLVNDTQSLGSGTTQTSASASYLLTAGREARTLQPNTNPAGKITTPAAPVTTGGGVGYLLRDRHTSVTALVDSAGAVTNTYAYADYGAPALLDGRPGSLTGAAPAAGAGRSNPYTYNGGALRAMYSDSALGTFMSGTRFYDPGQGRFTSRDTANLHNRYVAFDTNPIMKVDPSGQSSTVDMLVDALFVVVFAVSVVATAGAAAIAGATVLAAAEIGAEVAAAVVRTAVTQAAATAFNLIGAATQAARLADDISVASGGNHFFDADTRQDLANVGTLAGGAAGAAGLVAAGWEAGLSELNAVRESQNVIADAEGVVPETSTTEGDSPDTSATETGESSESTPERFGNNTSDDDSWYNDDSDDSESDLTNEGWLGSKPKIPVYEQLYGEEFNGAMLMSEDYLSGRGLLGKFPSQQESELVDLPDDGWNQLFKYSPDADPEVSEPSNGVHQAQTIDPSPNSELPGTSVLDKSEGARITPKLSGNSSGSLAPLDQLRLDLPFSLFEE